MYNQKGFTLVQLIAVILMLAGGAGWVMNIVKLMELLHGAITGMMVLRGIGIFVAPLGSILGFIPN